MGKRQTRYRRNFDDDAILMSSVDDNVDYEALMQGMDRRNARRKSRQHKSARNRFDDYEQEKWLGGQVSNWDDLKDFDDDLDFEDYDH